MGVKTNTARKTVDFNDPAEAVGEADVVGVAAHALSGMRVTWRVLICEFTAWVIAVSLRSLGESE